VRLPAAAAVTLLVNVVHNESIHKHKMYGKDHDEAILYYYYVETRRRRRAIPEYDRLACQLQYLYPYTFKRPLLDGQLVDIIEHVLTR